MPVTRFTGTASPSTIPSFPRKLSRSADTMSGNCSVTSSSRLENSLISSSLMCAWILNPSYLYSNAHSPSFSNISSSDDSRSHSIARIGVPSSRCTFSSPASPSSASSLATRPRSDHTLYARSISSLLSFDANATAKASIIVRSAIPIRMEPVTDLTMYFASSWDESCRSSASSFIFRSWEPDPLVSAIFMKLPYTRSTVSGFAKSAVCFLFSIASWAASPMSPFSRTSVRISSSPMPVVNVSVLTMSFPASPSSLP